MGINQMASFFFINSNSHVLNINSRKNIPNKSLKSDKISMKIVHSNVFKDILKNCMVPIIALAPLVANSLPEVKPDVNIVDESGVLTKSSLSFLEKNNQKILDVSGTKLYIVSLRTLPYGEDTAEFTKNLFSQWNLGDKDVLVVLVNKIAKGFVYAGSEVKELNQATIKSIGEETFPFKAREEQYSAAAIDVSNRLVSILTKKGDPGPPSMNRVNDSSNFKSAKVTEEKRSKYVAIIIILLVIAFVVPMVQFFYYVKDE